MASNSERAEARQRDCSLSVADGHSYTLEPVLQHRSAPIDWIQLQRFVTWLMSVNAKTKCPLNLRNGRVHSHSNVFIAVPYLDSDYLMNDLDALKVVQRSTESGTLYRIKSPACHISEGECDIMKKFLFMEVKKQIRPDESHRIAQFCLTPEMYHNAYNPGHAENEQFEDLDCHPAEFVNKMEAGISEDQLLSVLESNVLTPRRLCRNQDQLVAAVNRYQSTPFTAELAPESASSSGEASVDDDSVGTPEFKFSDELLRRYASIAYQLRNDGLFPKTFALDCEMVSTTKGTELARITVIDSLLRVVFDALVQPSCTVTNYRTQYSGITEQGLAGVTITLSDVQAALYRMVDCETVLVGHSLHHDLSACEVGHGRVIDTALMYAVQNRRNKPSLKALAETHLKLDLLRDAGHDSYVDAATSMYLAMAGVLDLEPPSTRNIGILGQEAFSLLSRPEEQFPSPVVHLIDPMADHYKHQLDCGISLEQTSDDGSSVDRLVELLRSNRGVESACYYFLVLRDFQKMCLRKMFESPKNEEAASLTKRANPKSVCEYMARLSALTDRVVACLDLDDVMMMSNLSGDTAKVDVLSQSLHAKTPGRMSKLSRFLWRLYALGNGEPAPNHANMGEMADAPEPVEKFSRRTQIVTVATLKREHEMAIRDRHLNWAIFLTKKSSNKRKPTSQ